MSPLLFLILAVVTPPLSTAETASFTIARKSMETYADDLPALLRDGRMAPSFDSKGKFTCYKFEVIQPKSVYVKFGFRVGDCIEKVNERVIDSPQKAMEAYVTYKNADALQITFYRGKRKITHKYKMI